MSIVMSEIVFRKLLMTDFFHVVKFNNDVSEHDIMYLNSKPGIKECLIYIYLFTRFHA